MGEIDFKDLTALSRCYKGVDNDAIFWVGSGNKKVSDKTMRLYSASRYFFRYALGE